MDTTIQREWDEDSLAKRRKIIDKMSDELHRRKFANYYAYKGVWTLIAALSVLTGITMITADFVIQNL